MTAAIWNIAVEIGASFVQSLLIEDAAGDVCDLTGCTAAMQVRYTLTGQTALLTLTTENGGLILSPTDGRIKPDFDSNPLSPGTYVYDLKLSDSGGRAFRLVQGTITFIGGVTQV